MFFKKTSSRTADDTSLNDRALRQMIERTQAMIEFEPDGTIKSANQNFLDTVGYTLDEIVGQHHKMFVYPSFVKNPLYAQMWADLANGKSVTDQFPRLRKDGQVIWIQATYAPILDENDKVVSIVKIATEITARRREIAEIASALDKLRDGNLTHRCKPSSIEDIARLANSYNEAVKSFEDAISTVRTVAEGVERTSDEMDTSSGELSKRTENQAATLEQTAAAIEELTATVRSSAEGAKEVEHAVNAARTTAEESGQVVSDAINAMSQIEKSSEEIAKIISVINDIAFQTNLLALNAGVEAARAGDAGRGFAVVASEVRALAQRSADAAGEIKGLILESSKHVSNGVTLVGRAGTELENIIGSVNSISENVTTIARGSEEQATTLGEINTGINQLDEVTQHNAAMVEEANAASRTLANDAKEMTRQMARFTTVGGKGAANVTSFSLGEPGVSKPKPSEKIAVNSAPSAHDTPAGWEDF
ncbi:MAG: methyl-accepting chemotaxis protein [Epibacterium sp.]|nr:methyl-accepting chemotaxis protein [Epibacterium sp.]NQX75053.1 PAS domain S-box protein [Epibacterium sp.]